MEVAIGNGRVLTPDSSKPVSDKTRTVHADLSNLIIDYVLGVVVGREGLDLKTREMLTVASLVSLGNAMPQLQLHMRAALNVGVTPKELLEVVIQMAVYAGVPACMNGLTAYREAMAATDHELPNI